jgi:hypothetical protein
MNDNIETHFPKKRDLHGFRITLKAILLVCVIIFSCGCKPITVTRSSTSTPTVSKTSIMTIKSTMTLTPEQASAPTKNYLTETEIITIDPTSTELVEPTRTLIPTLLPETKHENLLNLILTNGGCDFPCWWGVQPSAPIQDTYGLHSILGEYPESYDSKFLYSISLDGLNLSDLLVEFFIENEIVQRIEVNLMYPSRLTSYIETLSNSFSISSVFLKYGKPTRVVLQVKPRSEKDSPITYSLLILYGDKGFSIQYDGLVNAEEPISICPYIDDYHLEYISLYLQDSQSMIDLQEILQQNHYLPIDSVTAMNLEDFFQAYSSNNEQTCFETSLIYWR